MKSNTKLSHELRYTIYMNVLLLIPYYFRWHYTRALRDLYHNLVTLTVFVFSWFSIASLLKTFFTPWRRLGDEYHKGFHPEEFLSAMIVNTILRLLGMSIRTIVIVVGLSAVFGIMLLNIIVFICWVFFPVLIAFFLAIVIKNLA